MRIKYEDFSFDFDEGLFYTERHLLDANISVVDKEAEMDLVSQSETIKYCIRVDYTDGRNSVCKWVDDIKKLDFWQFEINDSFLDKEGRQLIMYKLLKEAGDITPKWIVHVGSGLQTIDGNRVFVMGNRVFPVTDANLEVFEYRTPYTMPKKRSNHERLISSCAEYMNLLPGVTEILFYGALYAVVKPFLDYCDIKGGFVVALVGPPGHLKTTLVREYALWLKEKEEQEIGFYYTQRSKEVLLHLDNLKGQNFLLDDLRKVDNRSENQRQQQRLDMVARHVNAKGNCANVFITGELLSNMGIFSCIDRILQICIPRMDAVGIEQIKRRLSDLDENIMSNVALRFAEVLVQNFEAVIEDIKEYYCDNKSLDSVENGYATRISRYAMFLKLTEYLFCKYVCEAEELKSYHENFEKALNEQLKTQQRELQKIRQQEEIPNYIVDLYKIIIGNDEMALIDSKLVGFDINPAYVYKDKKVYMVTEELKRVLFEYYQRYIPTKEVIQQFRREGILEIEPNSKGYQKNYNGRKHYVFNMRIWVNYLIENDYSVDEGLKKSLFGCEKFTK